MRRCTRARRQKHAFESSEQMDAKVREMLQEGGGLYHLDIETLRALRPHVILTQSLCAVCAVDYALVARAAREMDPHPAVIDLNPQASGALPGMLANLKSCHGCYLRPASHACRASTTSSRTPCAWGRRWGGRRRRAGR